MTPRSYEYPSRKDDEMLDLRTKRWFAIAASAAVAAAVLPFASAGPAEANPPTSSRCEFRTHKYDGFPSRVGVTCRNLKKGRQVAAYVWCKGRNKPFHLGYVWGEKTRSTPVGTSNAECPPGYTMIAYGAAFWQYGKYIGLG